MINRDIRCACHPAQILHKYDPDYLEPRRTKEGSVTEVKCTRCKTNHYLGLIDRKLQEITPNQAQTLTKMFNQNNQSTTSTGGAFRFIKEESPDDHTESIP